MSKKTKNKKEKINTGRKKIPEKIEEPPKIEKLTSTQDKFYKKQLKDNDQRADEIWKVLDNLIVGEDNNKKIIFYNLISAKLKVPNGTIVVGNASSGKTHMVRETLKLFPKDMLIAIGGMSKKAMIHMKGDMNPVTFEKIIDLNGKIMYFLEESGGEESYAYLRPILSRDQEEIRFEIPTKKKAKKGSEYFQNDVIIIKGCPAYITTSTKEKRLAETGTRVFLLSPDESKTQNQSVIKRKTQRERFRKPNIDFEPFHYFMRNLESYDVWIPYADIIELNSDNLNVRRDMDKILSLIKAHVILNQDSREKVLLHGEECLVATLEDYFYIMDILLPVIKPTLFNLPKKIIDFYDQIELMDELLTHKNISLKLNMNQNTVKTYCWELVQVGWLLYEKEGNKNVYSIKPEKPNIDVTCVTRKTVTSNLVSRSREELKQWIERSVTENQGIIMLNGLNLEDFLAYTYNSSVTISSLSNSGSIPGVDTHKRGYPSNSNMSNLDFGVCSLCSAETVSKSIDLCPKCVNESSSGSGGVQ